jgi:1-acyl-sn-glycerol-3-phosphate acyltransferase
VQRRTYWFLRSFFYYFFTYLPYAPIRRVNKPDLSGPYIWASTHSNYLCDTVPPGFEGPVPTKYLAKSTLFRFPIKRFIEFCGALPVARADDHKDAPREARAIQNRSTFRAAIGAMEKGWPIAIFPEGVSLATPGIVLPLKPGVAKLAFAAEEANDFRLGLRIVPVGLNYGSRTKIGSGLTIRYGKVLNIADYRELYERSQQEAVQKVMEDLTRELLLNFPHFRDEHTMALGKKLVALGAFRSKFDAAQLFLRREKDDAFWASLQMRLRAFEEANKKLGIPIPAWGHRRAWKELGPARRRRRAVFLFLGSPFALFDLANTSLPELCLQSLVEYIAVDDTEKMSLRFMLSVPVLLTVYALQFLFLKAFVFENIGQPLGWGTYFAYAGGSFVLWYFGVHWRRQFKRVASLWLFFRAGVTGRSDAIAYYHALRKDLGDFEDHGRERSNDRKN